MFSIVALFALFAIVAGTTMRSIVPPAQETLRSMADLRSDRADLDSNTTIPPVERAAKLRDIDDRLLEAQKKRDALTRSFFPIPSADALLAFVFYSIVVISTMLSGLARTDPIFEYYLAFEKKAVSYRAFLMIEGYMSALRDEEEERMLALDERIASIKGEFAEEASEEEVADIKVAKAEIENLDDQMTEFVQFRCLRYAKMLSRIRNDKEILGEWECLFGDKNVV